MRLRIMTYNIHRAIGMDRRFRPERIVRIAEHHAPDILLLQEVDEGAPRSRETDLGRDLAQALGFPHFVVGHNVSLRKGRYGNATLSRYPILRERNIDLTIQSRKRRGCQHTTIEIEKVRGHAHRIDVFNLHLGLGALERVRQIGLLVRSKEFSELEKSQASFVGGDFNDWRSLLHPIFTEILQFGCATQRNYVSDGALRTYPSFSPSGGLDRIYYRGPIRALNARTCRLKLSRVASDHLPVIADFDLH
ncbi:MAG: endonuclease [Gammaproteobacteria bacterium]|nr:endonuclease [Gammaproteobacteria bacterium]NIM74223.1 endonuclease [Gammaproteobacteria bacterium]NIN39522.1 endonuclease [Gammaproteobacteria bacterium]NIO25995.1 endonuclease [Gammaproteobacteria bacterium]NIO66628.1 endonuclease [Gammaproteobacteria bacterium]